MEVFDAVRTVLAVREYQDKPVPPDAAHRIVEAAHLTASSMNAQPWHFIAVDHRDTLRQLAGIAPSGPYIARAPFAVVVCVERTDFAVSDASRAVQSMVLTGRHRLELGRLRRARGREAHPWHPRQPRHARDRPLRLPGEACRPGQEAAQAVRTGRE